jgi:hypothetical protein
MSVRYRTTISIDSGVAELAKKVGKAEHRPDFSNVCEAALAEYIETRGGEAALNEHAEFIAKISSAVARKPALKGQIEKLTRTVIRGKRAPALAA